MLLKKRAYPLPPEGDFSAVCCDEEYLGLIESQFGTKPKIALTWEIDEINQETGKRFTVSKRYTASLHEKSALARDLKTWFGVAPKDEFDTEKLIGRPCRIVIEHVTRPNGETFANVIAVLKPGKEKLTLSGKYVRRKDRPKDGQGGQQQRAATTDEPQDAPFPADHDEPYDPEADRFHDANDRTPF